MKLDTFIEKTLNDIASGVLKHRVGVDINKLSSDSNKLVISFGLSLHGKIEDIEVLNPGVNDSSTTSPFVEFDVDIHLKEITAK